MLDTYFKRLVVIFEVVVKTVYSLKALVPISLRFKVSALSDQRIE